MCLASGAANCTPGGVSFFWASSCSNVFSASGSGRVELRHCCSLCNSSLLSGGRVSRLAIDSCSSCTGIMDQVSSIASVHVGGCSPTWASGFAGSSTWIACSPAAAVSAANPPLSCFALIASVLLVYFPVMSNELGLSIWCSRSCIASIGARPSSSTPVFSTTCATTDPALKAATVTLSNFAPSAKAMSLAMPCLYSSSFPAVISKSKSSTSSKKAFSCGPRWSADLSVGNISMQAIVLPSVGRVAGGTTKLFLSN